MRLRFLFPIAFLALAALLGTSCSSSDDSSDSAARSSDERDNGDSDDSDSDSGNSGSDDSDSGDSGSGDLDDLPDLGDIADSIPGLGDLEGCFDLATIYSSLYLEALGGESGAREAQQKAEEMKDQVPSELHDDIDVIADAIGQVASEGILSGSEALDTPEYAKADAAVSEYFEQECAS